MKIADARVIICSPGRNFVTLKITTSQWITGIGDATLNGRELAVAAYLSEHVAPLLVGRDPSAIEIAAFAEVYGVRTGFHGATGLSPYLPVNRLEDGTVHPW